MNLLEDLQYYYTDCVISIQKWQDNAEMLNGESLLDELAYVNGFFGASIKLGRFHKEIKNGGLSEESEKELKDIYVLVNSDIVWSTEHNEFCLMKYA